MMPDNVREDIYAELLEEDRTIIINDPIDEDVIERVVIPIFQFNREDAETEAVVKDYERKPIRIFLNSPGGYANETLSVISAIEDSTTPVHTYALGKACSGAFFILLAGHQRFAQRYSTLLLHQVQSKLPDGGPAKQLEEALEESKRLQLVFDKITLKHTKLPKKVIDDVWTRKIDLYITAEEALKYKIIDGIINKL